jgi:hypothetical protein
MLRKLSNFSEREIREGTGIRRDTIRSFRHGGIVTRKMYHRFSQFLKEQEVVTPMALLLYYGSAIQSYLGRY